MLSVILFIFWPEEENLIEACLKTVSWADEIVVIDNGATKKTVEIVKKYTKNIHFDPAKDFASHHNLGCQKAHGDWVLFVDSDERVSYTLKKEIIAAMKNPATSAYQLYRENIILGKNLRFGDRYPDYVTRLFRKEKLHLWKGDIHESSEVNGKIEKLQAPLYHITHRDIYSMLRKTINFAEHEAQIRYQSGHPKIVWWRLVRVILTELWTRLVKYQGFRGGTEGWIDAVFQAFSLFVVYVRLWEMQQTPRVLEKYQELDKKILREFE